MVEFHSQRYVNLLPPAIGDTIFVPTQDMLIGLYVLTRGNHRGICANRYNPWNRKNYQNERIHDNNYKYTREPFFCNSYDAVGAYRQKRINLDSPLWLRWRLDQCVIASREAPIEVHYESLGTYHEIYGHYLIVRNFLKKSLYIHSNHYLSYFSLPKNRISYTRVFRAYSYDTQSYGICKDLKIDN